MRTRPSAVRAGHKAGSQPFAVLRMASAVFMSDHEEAAASGEPLLTEKGITYMQNHMSCSRNADGRQTRAKRRRVARRPLPVWKRSVDDHRTGELWLGDVLVKQFRSPGPHQVAILNAFQEQGWARKRTWDPIPRGHGESAEDAKRRLHNTIKNLNRGLKPGTIRFHGNGTGQGIYWDYDDRIVQR